MTELNDTGLSNQDDYLNTDNDKTQDAGNSDAAKFNTDEQENAVNEREGTAYANTGNIDNGSTASANETTPPLTTQGDIGEVEENMGGTTNLSLDQLKQEGDPEGLNDH